jgi:peptide/nickel transport system substrate-binding protein
MNRGGPVRDHRHVNTYDESIVEPPMRTGNVAGPLDWPIRAAPFPVLGTTIHTTYRSAQRATGDVVSKGNPMATADAKDDSITSPFLDRRRFLQLMGITTAGAAAVPVLAACSSGSSSSGNSNSSSSGGSSSASGSSSGGAGSGKSTLLVATPSLTSTFTSDGGSTVGTQNDNSWCNLHASLIRNPYKVDPKSNQLQQQPYEFEGWLAESFDVSADQLTYTFHLRKGVVSQAGNPFTADDVMFSYERKFLAPTAYRATNAIAAQPTFKGYVTKIDDFTVQMKITNKKYRYTLLSGIALSYTGIMFDSKVMKAHITKADPYAVTWSESNYNWGYGPYKVSQMVPQQQEVWEARPDAIFGEPKIKTITFRPVADAGTRSNTLKSGDVDLAFDLQPADMQSMLKNPKLSVPQYSNPNQLTMMTMTTTLAPFNDVKVRQAMCYAIPYDQIINNVYHGLATKAEGFLNPTAGGYISTGLPNYTFDPDKAKQLLSDAGHADGVSFSLAISDSVPDVQSVALQIQSFAKQAGFDIKIQQVPDADYQANWYKYIYQAFLWRNAVWNQEPGSMLLNYVPNTPNNTANFRPASYYPLVDSSYDYPIFSAAAGKVSNQAEIELMTDAPLAWIVEVQPLVGAQSGLKDIAFRFDGAMEFSLMHWE